MIAGASSALGGEDTAQDFLRITGRPASAGFILRILKERLGIEAPIPGPLAPNGRLELEVPGTDPAGPVRTVVVENYDLPVREPEFLMFSDYPEKVRERGLLFSGGLIRHKPIRFQYYHQGHPGGSDRYLLLRLYNNGEDRARFHMLRGFAGPSGDFMKEGHQNSMDFLSRLAANEGEILTIESGSSLDLAFIPLPAGEVVSGTYQLHLLEGPPLAMYLFSLDNEKQPVSNPSLTDPADPHATGVFPIANFYIRDCFRSSEKERFLTIGDFALKNYIPHKSLAGAYGCVYNIGVMLENPGSSPAEIQLLFQPRGGHATATFIIGTETVPVGFTRAGKEVLLKGIQLQPGEKRELTIKTMPEGASFYPVRLIFRSR